MTARQDRESDCMDLMLSAAGQAKSYVEGMTKENFLGDPKTQDAVIRGVFGDQ